MKKTWLKRAVLSMVVLGSVTGMVSSVQAADVRILPVDNAKFLAGARFDFDVEVSKAENLKNVDVSPGQRNGPNPVQRNDQRQVQRPAGYGKNAT